MNHPIRRIGLLLLALIVASVWMSWPLAAQLGEVLTSGRADGDLGYTLSAHWWMGEVLSGDASFPQNNQVYFPYGQNMASSVWNFVALFLSAWPNWFLDPLSAYQMGLLVLMVLNGLAAALFGHRIGGNWGALGAACAILAFPYPWAEGFEGRLEQAFIAPSLLVFWAAIPFREAPQVNARRLGALMALVAVSYWFYAPIVALGLLVFLGGTLRQKATRRGLIEALVFCVLFSLPFLLLIGPALKGGAYELATSDTQHILYTRVGQSVNPWEVLGGSLSAPNLGRTLPILCVFALVFAGWTQPRSRRWLALSGVGLIFAMGPALTFGTEPAVVGGRLIPLPFGLLDLLPGLSRFWWPYRFLLLVGIGAAAAMALLFSRLPSARRGQLAMVIAGLFLLEGRLILMKATRAGDPTIPPSVWDPKPAGNFYAFELPQWMHDPPTEGGILEFPMAEVANAAPLYAPFHQLPTAHGDGVREPHIRPPEFEEHVRNNRMFSSWAQNLLPDVDPDSLNQLASLGFRYILVHQDPEMDPAVNNRTTQILGRLESGIGSPIHREPALTVFAIPSLSMD